MSDGLPDDLVALPTAPWDERPAELPLDVEECRTALWLFHGNISKAAEVLKVRSDRLRNFVNKSEYLKREMNEAREIIKDIAEGNVYDALTDKTDTGRRDTMTRFVLGSQMARDRGFGAGGSSGVGLPNTPKGRLMIAWDTEDPQVVDVTPKVANGN